MTRFDEGDPALSAQNFLLQTLRATWDNLPQLLLCMVWLNLCLAPMLVLALLGLGGLAALAGVLLAAPGWVALQHVQSKLVQGKSVTSPALLSSFRRFWPAGARLGALALALPLLAWLLAASLGGDDASPVLTVGALASLLVGSLLVLYAVPLLVMYEHDLPLVLRNAVILAARHIGNTLGMVALAVLGGLAAVYLSSGLLFVLPTLYGMFVANNCRLVLQEETKTGLL